MTPKLGRRHLVISLLESGLTPEEVAPRVGWKLSTVRKFAEPRDLTTPDEKRVYDMGFLLPVRAHRAVAAIRAQTVDEVAARLHEIADMPQCGAKTIAAIRAEIDRIRAAK